MTENSVNSMCKSARAMGMSKRKWLQIEDHVSLILRHSGPAFMISYLKDLKEYHEARLTGSELPKLDWHKVNRKGEPSGWQKHLHFRKPKTSIQIIGAMVNSIEYEELQDHQLDKWRKAVRSPEHVPFDEERRDQFFMRTRPSEMKKLQQAVKAETSYSFLKPSLRKLMVPSKEEKHKLLREKVAELRDYSLAKLIASQSVFQPEDVTGTSIPMFNSSLRIKTKRNKSTGSLEKSLEQTLQAYVVSINSAPAFAGQMEIDRIALIKERYPHLEITDEKERLDLAERIRDNGQNLVIEDSLSGYDLFDDESYTPSPWITPRLGMNQRAGHIAFLQQAGGKLRAIANPNRYLQHLMRPLQKDFSEVNKYPEVAVTRQDEGILWASSMLAQGKTLHSFDLSSATDTLHAVDFLRSQQMGPILENEVEYFNFASHSYWFSPDLGEDVNWDKGQPLGLAPSFSLLTIMNREAGIAACRRAGFNANQLHEHFRVVGDDFICTSDIAPYYYEEITKLGGVINLEKSLVSNTHAEFCSQIITKDGSWPLKPKIRGTFDSIIVDSEKGSLSNVMSSVRRPKGFKKTAEYLSTFSSSDLRALPSIVSSDQRSYAERLGAAVHLSMASRLNKSGRLDKRSIAVGPATSLSIQKAFEDPRVPEELLNNLSGSSPVDDLLSHSSVRMNVDQRQTTYNHKLDDYEPVLRLMEQSSNLEVSLKEIEENSILSEDKSVILIHTKDESNAGLTLSSLIDLSNGEIIVEGDTEDILYNLQVDLGSVYNSSTSGILSDEDFSDIELSVQHYVERNRVL